MTANFADDVQANDSKLNDTYQKIVSLDTSHIVRELDAGRTTALVQHKFIKN